MNTYYVVDACLVPQ